MNLNDLQREVGNWADHNFGSQPPSYPLLGMSEELGELSEAYLQAYMTDPHSPGVQDRVHVALELQAALGRLNHSILKRLQGIRLDDPDVGEEAEYYAMQQIRKNLKQFQQTPHHPGREIKADAVPDPTDELVDSVADTVIYQADFCHRAGVDLDAAVTDTWRDVVSDREWDSDLGDA